MPLYRKSMAPAALLIGAFALFAASLQTRSAEAQAGLSSQDSQFLRRAIEGANLQIELGKVAAVQGESPGLREIAQTGVQSFSKAEKMLGTLAERLHANLQQISVQDVRMLRHGLAADSGPVLDEEFVAQVLPANTVAVNLFSSEAQRGNNPALVQFARDMLPALQERQANLLHLTFVMGGLIAGADPNPPMRVPEYQSPENPATKSEALRHG
jgi:predicted outer membrane protein